MSGSAYHSVGSASSELRGAIEGALRETGSPPPLPIALIGCGWIGGMQLEAYRAAGFTVVAVCDRHLERAEDYRDRYFPDARAYDSVDELIAHPGLAIVDVATHLEGRPETVLRCIQAGLNVLSQKPFVEQLSVGIDLAQAARDHGVILAVNQNGRWAPHFGAMLAVVDAGLIGEVVSADFSVFWPHDEIIGGMPAFASMEDLILFDFGAHWFDLIGALAPPGQLAAEAVAVPRRGQSIAAPLQASATVAGDGFVATVDFRAGERFAETGTFRVSGTAGVISHTGLSLGGTSVEVANALGTATVSISDDWFSHGLTGAMRALLDAVAAGTPPPHTPESALRGLEIAFAALESARRGGPVEVGTAISRG